MASLPGWTHDVIRSLRKPLDKDDYRVLGMFGAGGFLLGATIGFIAGRSWEFALIVAISTTPSGLFGGVMHIAL